jgi:hypothetical protein
MFEGAQQQVGNKGAHDLHRQGILTFTERTLDLEYLLDPLPPILISSLPNHFIFIDHKLFLYQPITYGTGLAGAEQ